MLKSCILGFVEVSILVNIYNWTKELLDFDLKK